MTGIGPSRKPLWPPAGSAVLGRPAAGALAPSAARDPKRSAPGKLAKNKRCKSPAGQGLANDPDPEWAAPDRRTCGARHSLPLIYGRDACVYRGHADSVGSRIDCRRAIRFLLFPKEPVPTCPHGPPTTRSGPSFRGRTSHSSRSAHARKKPREGGAATWYTVCLQPTSTSRLASTQSITFPRSPQPRQCPA
jgi:hypothetical protein